MRDIKKVIIYGFAIFAMFFGSGNLVFPLQIGHSAGQEWLAGFAGLFITGILLPFLGLFVIKLHRGKYGAFFCEAGTIAGHILPFVALSLLGAFGVVPRCITVAFGGIDDLFPQLPLWLFSAVFCLSCFVICLKDSQMIDIIGKWMSPILILSITLLIFIGVYLTPEQVALNITAKEAFTNGFLVGYQTMDLLAAFFFSSVIFLQLQSQMDTKATHKEIILAALKPSVIGASLLALIYLGFVYLGSHYAHISRDAAPELILPKIAAHTMGPTAAIIIAIAVLFSCLTTAVALNNIYARYLCNLTPWGEKSFIWMLSFTTLVSFVVSLLDFRGIASFLAPILEVSYPAIITLTVSSILMTGKHHTLKKTLFYGVLGATILYKFI